MCWSRLDIIAVGLGSRVASGRRVKSCATWASGTPWPRWRGVRTGGASRWAARAVRLPCTTWAASWSRRRAPRAVGCLVGAATSSRAGRGSGRRVPRRARVATQDGRSWKAPGGAALVFAGGDSRRRAGNQCMNPFLALLTPPTRRLLNGVAVCVRRAYADSRLICAQAATTLCVWSASKLGGAQGSRATAPPSRRWPGRLRAASRRRHC